mmetsp:Transcript_16691/g.67325  ORF Transcript_16691/g.67325 Transcript_16691/m.67325 type:complete len:135 (+) Transcript_16691:117-521(+)
MMLIRASACLVAFAVVGAGALVVGGPTLAHGHGAPRSATTAVSSTAAPTVVPPFGRDPETSTDQRRRRRDEDTRVAIREDRRRLFDALTRDRVAKRVYGYDQVDAELARLRRVRGGQHSFRDATPRWVRRLLFR